MKKTPTELRYIEQFVFIKEVKNENLWKFELGSQESMNVSIWIIVGFQQKDRQDPQILNNDTFCWLPVASAQCIIGTEKYPDAGILSIYDDDDYSQGYHQTKEAFKALTKDNITKPYYSDEDFRSSNDRADDVGYNLYVFDIRYQKTLQILNQLK